MYQRTGTSFSGRNNSTDAARASVSQPLHLNHSHVAVAASEPDLGQTQGRTELSSLRRTNVNSSGGTACLRMLRLAAKCRVLKGTWVLFKQIGARGLWVLGSCKGGKCGLRHFHEHYKGKTFQCTFALKVNWSVAINLFELRKPKDVVKIVLNRQRFILSILCFLALQKYKT